MAASFSLPLSPGVTFGGNRLVSFPDALKGRVLIPSTTGLMSAKSDGRLLVIGPRPPGAARAPMAILVTTGRLQGVRAAKALDAWELDVRAGVPVPVPLGAWAVAKPGEVGVWEGEDKPGVGIGDVLRGKGVGFRGHRFMTGVELSVLDALVKENDVRTVLEIGVNEGMTASELLRSNPSITGYVGVDLSDDAVAGMPRQRHERQGKVVGKAAIGDPRFSTWMAPGGSRDYPRDGRFDMVIIDGDHSYGMARHDTELAAALGARVVAWHDYGHLDGVTRVVDEDAGAVRVSGTRLAYRATSGVVLLVGFYKDANAKRNGELRECLRRNLANPFIGQVRAFLEDEAARPEWAEFAPNPKAMLVEHGRRCTYQDFVLHANKLLQGLTIIVSNADIWFDTTIKLIRLVEKDEMLCISRRDGNQIYFGQDSWAFQSPLKEFPCNWELGQGACEARFAWEARNAGLRLRNPAKDIVAVHEHRSGIRRQDKRIQGPILRLPVKD